MPSRFWKIVFFATFVLLFIGHTIPLIDPDMWWHIAIGQDILRTGHLPAVDTYSHTMFGQPWHYPDWLGGVLLALLYQLGGVPGLILGISAVFTLIYVVLWDLCRSMGMDIRWWPVTAFSLHYSLALFTLGRPQTFGFLFFAIVLWLLVKSRKEHPHWLFWIPVVQILWINTHRSALLTPCLLLAALVLGEKGDRKRTLWVFALSCLATAVHPDVRRLLTASVPLFTNPEWRQHVSEWAALSPKFFLMIYATLLVSVVLLGLTAIHRPRLFKDCRTELVFGLLLFVVGFRHNRMLAFSSVALVPLAFHRLCLVPSRRLVKISFAYSVLLVGSLIFSWWAPAGAVQWKRYMVGWGVSARFPKAAADLIQEELPGSRLFNVLEDGGYLLFRLRGESKVFVDGRTFILYPMSITMESVEALSSRASWDRITREHDIDVAVLPMRDPDRFASFLSGDPRWPVVFFDDYHVVHVRSDRLAEHPGLNPLTGVDLREPLQSMRRLKRTDPKAFRRLRTALSAYAMLAPGSFKIAVLRAFTADLDHDYAEERVLLNQALKVNPNYDFGRERLRNLPN
ncbi:MAG: hypothetical protein V1798_04585 [Pseudomonadota bacterium]